MSKNVADDRYFFIKVTDRECVRAKDDKEALKKAIKAGIVDPANLEDYVVVTKDCYGQTIAGVLSIKVEWQDG